jgi:protein-disulfide isomerase
MMKAQDEEGDQGFGDERTIMALTRKLGLDADKLKELTVTNKDKYMKDMTDDRNEGAANGINGTPGFIIGKSLIAGADSVDKFKAIIDAELKK